MLHAYVLGGIVSWVLACVAAVALAQAAGRECPTPTSDVSDTSATQTGGRVRMPKAEVAKTA